MWHRRSVDGSRTRTLYTEAPCLRPASSSFGPELLVDLCQDLSQREAGDALFYDHFAPVGHDQIEARLMRIFDGRGAALPKVARGPREAAEAAPCDARAAASWAPSVVAGARRWAHHKWGVARAWPGAAWLSEAACEHTVPGQLWRH